MATNIGRLHVDFIARTGKFTQGIKKAERRLQVFSGIAQSIARRGLFIGLGAGTASVAALSIAVRAASKNIDEMSKTGQKLGLLPEQLQRMRLAAKLAGVESSKMEMGFQRMTRRIAEAANGTGEAQGAIKALGLEAKTLAALSPEQQFKTLAGAMSKVSNQGEKVLLAFKLFDSEGVDLIRLMNDSGKAIDDAGRFIEQYGLKLSAVDTTKIEMMNDSASMLQQIMKGVAEQIAVNVAPAFIELTGHMLDWAKTSGGVGKIIFDVFQKIAETIDRLLGKFDGVKKGFAAIAQAKFQADLKFYKGQLGQINDPNDPRRKEILAKIRDTRIALNAADKLELAPERERDKTVKWLDGVKERINKIAEAKSKAAFNLADGTPIDALIEQYKMAEEKAAEMMKPKRVSMGREVELAFTALGGPGTADPALRTAQESLRVEKQQADLLRQLVNSGGGVAVAG